MSEPSNTTELACSLNDEDYRDRRKFVRESLVPKVLRSNKTTSGLELTFENTEELRSDVALFAELESQCCGFLSFSIASTEEYIVLTVDGPPEADDVLARFVSGFTATCARGSDS